MTFAVRPTNNKPRANAGCLCAVWQVVTDADSLRAKKHGRCQSLFLHNYAKCHHSTPVISVRKYELVVRWISDTYEWGKTAFQLSLNRRSINAELSVDLSLIETWFMRNWKTTAHEMNIYAVSLNIYSFFMVGYRRFPCFALSKKYRDRCEWTRVLRGARFVVIWPSILPVA